VRSWEQALSDKPALLLSRARSVVTTPVEQYPELSREVSFQVATQGSAVVPAVERRWHMHDSHGQIRALASRSKSLKSLKVSLFARKPLGMRNEDAGVLVGRPSAQPTLLLSILCQNHCRANSAHTRQSRLDSGLGFQVKVLENFQVVPSAPGNSQG